MKPLRLALGLTAALLVGTIACDSDELGTEGHGKAAGRRKASPETLAKGHALYKTTCTPCHGEGGKGDGPAGRIFKPPPQDHTNATYMDTLTDEDLGKTIQMGGAIKGKPSMPSNPQIRGEELAALIAHIRSLSHPER